MKKKKTMALALAGALATLSLTACAQLDVIGQKSIPSFGAVLEAAGDKVQADAAGAGWSLMAPDGTARFVWSGDYSKSPLYDVMLELDAQPFVGAGLDPAKLPEGITLREDRLLVGRKLGEDAPAYSGGPDPLAAYEQLVALYPDALGYHGEMDHYGVDVGGGNLFEWARDMDANQKDMVFVLNPQPLIDAGLDPSAVEGWTLAKIKMHMTEVERLVKPFDLK